MMARTAEAPAPITLRHPSRGDGPAIWALVQTMEQLESNSCYAYLLLATHFGDTCLVAEADGRLVGFVAAYRPPKRPDVIFVWQIGVHAEARGQGLGGRLLNALIAQPACRTATHLEATVAHSCKASQHLFSRFAKARGTPCHRGRGFAATDFGPLAHEAETLFRIGPLRRDP
ncbi:MAG: diaminobutyrate acetyltransferase [Myxococcales bacterium]|nr:diaminobutyrate acetyltransferase [Myxococcales bacterium]